jgi:hypothetical protein
MKGKQLNLNGEPAGDAGGRTLRCAHSKLITRIDGEGRYFVHCLDCKLEGAPHDTVTDAFLHRQEDLEDAAALKMMAREKERSERRGR